MNNKLISNPGKASTESSGSLASTSCAPTLGPTFDTFPALVFILGPAFIAKRYTDKNLQKTTKFILEFFCYDQKHGRAQVAVIAILAPAKSKLFEAYFSKL